MDTTELVTILAAVISAVGSIIVAIIQTRKNRRERMSGGIPVKKNKLRFLVVIFSSFAIFLLGFFLGSLFGDINEPTQVGITYPLNQTSCQITETVQGTSNKLPLDTRIWIIIKPQENDLYYPQNKPAETDVNGNWSSVVSIGLQGDVGEKFEIIAVLADESAQNSFSAYIANGRENNSFEGMQQLPDGVQIYDQILVTRK